MNNTNDLISRAAATRAAVISVRDYLGNIDSERDVHIEEGLHEVPAVDAIPVAWLREKMKIPCMTCANPFDYVLLAWRDEQELGIEPNEGV